jgi:hypothetical protein
MHNKQADRSFRSHTRWSRLFWTGLFSINGLWIFMASDLAELIVPLTALAAAAGFSWKKQRSERVRRQRTALDAYADREIARARSQSAFHRVKSRRRTLTRERYHHADHDDFQRAR